MSYQPCAFFFFFFFASQERIIERLKEQRERDDRERLEEIESFRKENKDLKEKVNALQAELTEKEVSLEKQMYHIHSPKNPVFVEVDFIREHTIQCEDLGNMVTFLSEGCLNSKETIPVSPSIKDTFGCHCHSAGCTCDC